MTLVYEHCKTGIIDTVPSDYHYIEAATKPSIRFPDKLPQSSPCPITTNCITYLFAGYYPVPVLLKPVFLLRIQP